MQSHGLQITRYKEVYGQLEVIEKVFHKCHLCGKIVLMDSDTLGAHIKRAHKMKERDYKKKFCIYKPAAGVKKPLKIKKSRLKKFMEEPPDDKISQVSCYAKPEKEQSEENEINNVFNVITSNGKCINAVDASNAQSDSHRDNTQKQVTVQKTEVDFVVLDQQDRLAWTKMDRENIDMTKCFLQGQEDQEHQVSKIQQSVKKKEMKNFIPDDPKHILVGTRAMNKPLNSEVMEKGASDQCTNLKEVKKDNSMYIKEESLQVMEEGENVIFSAEGTNTKEEIKGITTHIKEEPLEIMEEGENVIFSSEGTYTKEQIKAITTHIKEEPLDVVEEGENVIFSAEGTNIKEEIKDIASHITEEPSEGMEEGEAVLFSAEGTATTEEIKHITMDVKEEPLEVMEEGEVVNFSSEGTKIKEEIKDSFVHVQEQPLQVMEEGKVVSLSAEGTNIKEDIEDLSLHIKEEPLDSLVENIYSRGPVLHPIVALAAVQGAASKELTEDYSLYTEEFSLYTEVQLGEVYRSRGLSPSLGGRGANLDQAKNSLWLQSGQLRPYLGHA